jgi:hypothetical protein
MLIIHHVMVQLIIKWSYVDTIIGTKDVGNGATLDGVTGTDSSDETK